MSLDSIVGDIDVTKLSSILSLTALNELGMPLAGNTTNQFSHDTCPKAYDRVMIGWSQPVITKDHASNMPPAPEVSAGASASIQSKMILLRSKASNTASSQAILCAACNNVRIHHPSHLPD